MTTPLERLRFHVSGAIERGEAVAITEVRAVSPKRTFVAFEIYPGKWAVEITTPHVQANGKRGKSTFTPGIRFDRESDALAWIETQTA